MAVVASKSSYSSIDPIMTRHRSGSQSKLESSSDSYLSKARPIINAAISEANSDLLKINRGLHSNPEIGYQEHFAHETISNYLSSIGFAVKRHSYGLDTSFEAKFGSEGRLVIICAEYDALPGIGHSCGHNLIATSSIATFIAAAKAMETCGIKGRLRLLGTPAEEGGGGKAKLIDAGAFPEETSLSLMCHPMTGHGLFHQPEKYQGLAGLRLIASHKFHVEFRGKSAHAAGEPWNGVNALDAAVAAYTSVGLLRQQIEPDERIHCVIEEGGTVPNIITEYTRMCWNVRSPTIEKADALLKRVRQCIEAAGLSTGCKVEFKFSPTYMNLRANDTLCRAYAHEMSLLGSNIMVHQEKSANASTDMGNVSHTVPSFHGAFAIPTTKDVSIHNPSFASCAGTDEAHEAALKCAEGMAGLTLRVMTDDDIAHRARVDFEKKDQ